jgi:hypothetical protein
MIILYDNQINNATITSSSENPYYTWSDALLDTRTTRLGRFIDVSSEYLQFDYASAIDVDYVYLVFNNITSSATVKVQANTTDSWTTPPVDQALTYLNGNWIYGFSTKQSYQYWRITVQDPTNTDGYIEISKIFLGEKFVCPGSSPDPTFAINSNAEIQKSVGGQLYGDRRVQLRQRRFTFPSITYAEKLEFNNFFDYVDQVIPFYLLYWENDLDKYPPLYSNLVANFEYSQLPHNGNLWTIGLETEEAR